MLFSAHTGSMALGLVIGIIQAKWMEPKELGRFTFCLTIIVLGGLFFEFGIFSAGSRVLALAGSRNDERRALGALVLMAAGLGSVFAIFVAAAAAPIAFFFDKDVKWLLLAAAAFAFFQPFQWLVEQSCQGLNQIRRLSVFQLITSLFYLLILLLLALAHRLTAGTALIAYLSGIGLGAVWALTGLKPTFKDVPDNVRRVLREARGYGVNVYLARITGQISSRFDNLIIAYFVSDLAPLGLYTLAQKLASPISTISRSIAITRFRAFARLDRVPKRIARWNALVLIGLSTGLVVFGPFALRLLFPGYSEAAPLLVPFAAISLFVGLFQPYNMFLASHGRGAELRNIAVMVTVASVAGLILILPLYGVKGAAWTGAAAMALDYLLHLYYYRKLRRELRKEPFAQTV